MENKIKIKNYKTYTKNKENLSNNTNAKISEKNNNQIHLFTKQLPTNQQKLLDFISDKNKLILKSFFDNKGSNDFLSGKNEALKEIELDATISSAQNENNMKEEKTKSKTPKKVKKQKSSKSKKKLKLCQEDIKKENYELENSPKKRRKKKIISYLHSNNDKFFVEKEKNKYKYEEESTYNNMHLKTMAETGSIVPKNKNIKDKNNNIKLLKDTKISVFSLSTIDSKIFNNKIDFEKNKNYMDKDDSLLEIIYQLKSNKKLNKV